MGAPRKCGGATCVLSSALKLLASEVLTSHDPCFPPLPETELEEDSLDPPVESAREQCRGGRGGNSGRGGRGQGGRGKGANATMPRKASEVGACKELEGHIFTIGSGNKGKDGDMLRTSMEKMTTYIGTKFGDEAAQEWISGKKIVPVGVYTVMVCRWTDHILSLNLKRKDLSCKRQFPH